MCHPEGAWKATEGSRDAKTRQQWLASSRENTNRVPSHLRFRVRFSQQPEHPMKQKLCDINQAATDKLPPKSDDKSGIGVHYVDAFLKPMNTKLEDGTQVKAKRRGLKITLQVGTKKGEGLMRRLDVSPDPTVMLPAALQEAAKAAGVQLTTENNTLYITP